MLLIIVLHLGLISYLLVVIFCFVLGDMASMLMMFSLTSYFRDVIYSCVSSKFTSAQNCTADLLFQCILIRDGRAVLPPWFLSSDISDIMSCLCTDL